ncbi:hypothetical protein Naga_101074g1, partial [Nannochloropsis gaditana]
MTSQIGSPPAKEEGLLDVGEVDMEGKEEATGIPLPPPLPPPSPPVDPLISVRLPSPSEQHGRMGVPGHESLEARSDPPFPPSTPPSAHSPHSLPVLPPRVPSYATAPSFSPAPSFSFPPSLPSFQLPSPGGQEEEDQEGHDFEREVRLSRVQEGRKGQEKARARTTSLVRRRSSECAEVEEACVEDEDEGGTGEDAEEG